MSAIRNKWKNIRKKYKKDLSNIMSPTLAMLIIETYTAWRHRRHIYKTWEFLGFNHREVYKEYCDKLMGDTLSGNDEFYNSLHFCEKEFSDKYRGKYPELLALGTALAMAYNYLKKMEFK